jgi:hypothetical protein
MFVQDKPYIGSRIGAALILVDSLNIFDENEDHRGSFLLPIINTSSNLQLHQQNYIIYNNRKEEALKLHYLYCT